MATNNPLTDHVDRERGTLPLRPHEVLVTVRLAVDPDALTVAPPSTVVQTLAETVASQFESFLWCVKALVHVNAGIGARPPFPSKDALEEGREGLASFDLRGAGGGELEDDDDE